MKCFCEGCGHQIFLRETAAHSIDHCRGDKGFILCPVCQIKFQFGKLTAEEIETQRYMDKIEDQKFRYQGL